jgi:formate dehydrogenase subunit beta
VACGADLIVGLIGVDTQNGLIVQAATQKGESCLEVLALPDADEPPGRKQAIAALVARRTAARDEMFAATAQATHTLEKLTAYLAACVNCYNCRVACPVCYCKECVFVTDVFNHEPSQYLKWAERKGAIKMPTDTVFYHITRLAHMSTACVGCGQCSNACPNDIPVMELFRTVAYGTQRAFDYEAGRSIADSPPLSVFREDEFESVVGITAA